MPDSRSKKSIKDVAAAARVSVATVSRTLQYPDVVAEATRKRVHEAIRQLRYTPNAQARNLRTSMTRLVIALVPDIANPFYSEVIRGIEQVAHENRYSILLGDTQNSIDREQIYAELIASRQADGLITLIAHIPKLHIEGRLPVVNACDCVADRSISTVSVDNVAAATTAEKHLLTLGHRHIAFIAGPTPSPISSDRQRGYELAIQQGVGTLDRTLMTAGDYSVESGIRAVEHLYAKKLKFSAIFCSNDEMAIGAIRGIKASGRRIPEDVSVIGFDDIRFARYTDPPLTTISQPKNELGREAMSMLIEILRGTDTPTLKRVLAADLIVRNSTAPPQDAGHSRRR
jgi:LacI family repressor for deo operon, udp, cdd, tsx, nupC, and nupG